MGIKNDKPRKRALLLHYAGEEVNEIFETLPNTGDNYDTAVARLTEYFSPKKKIRNSKYTNFDKPNKNMERALTHSTPGLDN